MIKGTSILREQNKRKVLSCIRQLGETSRQDLVEMLDVSKNTISLVVDELISEGVLVEIGVKEPSRKGRPKILIKLKNDGYKSIGLSISRANLEYSVINYYGQVLKKESFSIDGTNAVQTKQHILETIQTLKKDYNNLIGIGIGIPGIIDSDKKFVHTSTNLGWTNVSLQFLNDISIPTYVQNSVNMGAISASNLEGDKDSASSFYVRVREGVGGAYLINNMIMNGASWTAGEIGHIAIDSSKERCNCGQKGCLELLINQDEFIKKVRELGFSLNTVNGEIDIDTPLLQSGQIKKEIYQYGVYLGRALIQVVHLMNPNRIVIDAPYNVYKEFQQGCKAFLEEHALTIPIQQTDIIFGYKQYNMSRGAALSAIINYENAVL